MIVIKRDGREEEFNADRIRIAVSKAFAEVDGGKLSRNGKRIANKIASYVSKLPKKRMSVEEIQDIVEMKLMESNRKDVAKAYILYRDERTKVRHKNSELMRIIGEKIQASNIQNQNANVDERSFGGRKGEADSELMRTYALDNCMSEMARNNHLNNEIYEHDLDNYAVGCHNCLSIPFDKLLANGFNTRQTDVRPAQSISTAFQLLAVIFQLQSLQQFGGCSSTHLDWTMVPYVRKSFYKYYADGCKYIGNLDEANLKEIIGYARNEELSIDNDYFKQDKAIYEYAMDMTRKELYQAVEGMYHNLNAIWAA